MTKVLKKLDVACYRSYVICKQKKRTRKKKMLTTVYIYILCYFIFSLLMLDRCSGHADGRSSTVADHCGFSHVHHHFLWLFRSSAQHLLAAQHGQTQIYFSHKEVVTKAISVAMER